MRTKILIVLALGIAINTQANDIETNKALADHIKSGSLTLAWLDKQQFTHDQLNTPIERGLTPLGLAIEQDMPQAIDYLIAAGANVHTMTNGLTPLEFAAHRSYVLLMQQLMIAGAQLTVPLCRRAPELYPVFYYLLRIFKPIKFGNQYDGDNCFGLTRARVDECLDNMLLHVIDDRELVQLLEMGAHVEFRDELGKTALDYAVENCHWKIAAILLGHGSPEARNYALSGACKELGQATTLERTFACANTAQLLRQRVPVDSVYRELLVHIQHKTLTPEFLGTYFVGLNRLNINRTYSSHGGADALFFAVQAGDYDTILWLLVYGARPHLKALAWALEHSPKRIVRLLVSRGARLFRIKDFLTRVIMHNPDACEIVAWLAPLVGRQQRNQALRLAKQRGCLEMVEALENAGAHA